MYMHQGWAAFTSIEIVIKGTNNYTFICSISINVFAVGLLFLPIYTIGTRSFIINKSTSIWNQSNREGFYKEGKGDGNNSSL